MSSEFFPFPEQPSSQQSSEFPSSEASSSSSDINGNPRPPIVTRKEFPETWLFDCVDKYAF